jgi:hypothetical protein
MERWQRYFYDNLNSLNGVEIREEVVYQGPEQQTDLQQKIRYGK